MKKIILVLAIMTAGIFSSQTSAQVRLNVNINIGDQPRWGPSGYDYVDYYYMPDIEVYYHVPRRQYVYYNGGSWVYVSSLPARYSNYDLYRGYKVVINEPRPYLQHNIYKVKYAGYKGWYGKQSNNNGNGKYKGYKSNNGRGNMNKHKGNKGRGRGNH